MLINLAAFPGLGTRLAGRRWAWAQMTLMVGGFCLVMAFMFWFFVSAVRYLGSDSASVEAWRHEYRRVAWVGWTGLALVVISWCWAGVSSLAIWRDSKSHPPSLPSSRPH